MNSSVMDSNQPAQPKDAAMSANAPLDLDAQSPPRPPFSPLTEAATDSGTREPSVNPGATLDQDEQQDQNASASATADANPSLSSALVNSNSSSNFNSNSSNSNLSHLNVSQINGASAMDNVTMDMGFDAGMDMYGQGITPATNILMAIARSYTQTQQQQQQHQHQHQHQRRQSQLPSTIHPAQVSRTHSALDVPDALMAIPEPSRAPPPVEPRLESFARIEFADSVFQMTTYAVVIGRDVRALELARKQEKEDEAWRQIVDQYARQGLPPPPRPELNRRKFTRSYVSEEGGMLGPESEDEEYVRPAKRRRVSVANSASGDSSMAQQEAAMAAEQAALNDKSLAANRQYVWHTPGSASVNLNALRPSPYTVPFIGIHSPGPDIAKKTKGISRQHLRIEYDQNEGVFKAYPLHRNGIFIDDKFHKDEGVTLRSGNRIQIKEVEFKFIINGVAEGKTGAEEEPQQEAPAAVNRRYSEGGKEMSFDFESSHDAEKGSTSPEEVPVEAAKESSESELSDLDEEMPDAGEPEDAEGEEDQEVMETIEQDAEEQLSHIKPEDMTPEMLAALPLLPPKKRGPGRPPKNGIMSKREERLRKKAAMELAKKNMPPPTPGEPPIKRKVGRPRKHPLPENTPDRPEKRKYKPRKSKNGEEGEMSETEKTLEKRRREKPKTPPLELNRADYTEEQLQKPNKNYGILIDEVLSAAPPDGLTLKQIYKRIQMKYPFYYFTVDTKGWESSVRHNLIGNVAFKKNEETHLWARVPGIDIDAGKKRKAASPDHSTSIHSFGQHYQPTAAPQVQQFHSEAGAQQGYRPGAGPPPRPGYPASQSQMNLGQHPHQQLSAQPVGVSAQQALHQPYQSTAQGNGIPQMADQGAAQGSRPISANPQATAYSSPYASRPPPSASPQAGNVPQSAQRQQLPHQNGAAPHNGVPQPNNASPHPASAAGVKPGQPISTSGTPAPIKPSIHPRLVEIIRNFRKTVTSIGAIRSNVGDAGEAIAMSVINRGLGLANQSTTPTYESIEKIVLNVFESQTAKQLVGFEIAPKLIERLVSFKRQMINTLKDKMKPLEAEQLVLSAIDRVLGFADKSIMQGTDAQKTSYELAEGVLMPAVQREIAAHDKEAAAASMPPTPTPAPSQVRTPAQMPAPGKHPSTPHSTAAHQSATAARPGSVPAAQTPVQMQNQPPRPVYTPAQQAHMAQKQPRATVGQPAPAGTSNGNPINAQYMNQNAVSGSGAGPAGARPIAQVAPAPQSQVAPAPVAQGDAPARSQASAGSTTSSNQNRPQSHGMPVQAYPHLQAAQAQYRTQASTQSQQQNPAAAQQQNQQPRVQPGQAQQAPSYSVQNQQPQQQAQNQQAAQQIQNRPPQSPAPTPARIQGQSHPVHARPAQGGQSPLQVQSQIQGQVQGQVQGQSQGQKPVPGQGQAQSQAPNQQTPVQQTQGQYQPRPQVAVSAQQVQQHAQQPSPQQAQQQALQQTQQHAQQQPRTQPTQAQPVQAYQTQAQQARVQQQPTPQQTARQQPVQQQPIQQVAQPSVQPSHIQQAHVQQPQAQHAQASPTQAQQPPTQQIQAQQPLVQQAYAQSSYARPTTPAQAAQMSRAQARPQVQPQGPVQAPSQASGASPAPSPAQKPVPGPAQVSAPRVPSPTTQAQPSQAAVPSIQNAAPLQNQMPAHTQASAQQPLSTTQPQPSKPWGPAVPSPPAAQSNKPSPQLSSQAAPSAASKVSIPAPTVTAPSASPSPIQRLAPTPGMIPLPPKPPAPVATPPPQASAASADSVSSAAPASSSAAAYIPPPPTPTPPAT